MMEQEEPPKWWQVVLAVGFLAFMIYGLIGFVSFVRSGGLRDVDIPYVELDVRIGDGVEPRASRAVRELGGELNRRAEEQERERAAKVAGVSYSVNDWWYQSRTDYPRGDVFGKPGEGKRFVVVDVTVWNGLRSRERFGDEDFRLVCSDGQVRRATGLNKPREYLHAVLVPGGSARGRIAFDVPIGVEPLQLEYDPW